MLRRRLAALAGLTLIAALLALAASSPAGADDNGSSRAGDADAGTDDAPPNPAPPAGSAVETTESVSNEAEYRAALIALSADASGPHVIEITASFVVDDGTDPVYDNATEALTVNGNGFTVTSGTANQRFLDVDDDVDLTINDLTVEGFSRSVSGGAIDAGATVTVNNSTFIGNIADGDGGAIDVDDGATLNGSTFIDNEAQAGDGGAVDTSGDGAGITAVDSTFSGNEADFAGGALSAEADISAERSTFVGNESEEGAAIGSYGSVELVNSTVTGNTGEFDIIDGSGDVTDVGNVTLIHVTIADNTVEDDEGVVDSDEDGVLTAFGTTISGTQGAGTNCEAGDFSTVSSSYNRSDDNSCDFTGTGDVENAGDPGLGALAGNGGPTETMLPSETSPLIDAIPEADCQLAEDQRGVSRPQDGLSDGTVGCDIGSVEVEGTSPTPPPPPDVGPIDAAPAFTG